jgi:hypothetical protein
MGLQLSSPGVVSANPLGYAQYPYSDGLKDLFYPTTDAATSIVNKVSGRSNAAAAANAGVTYAEGYAAFAGDPNTNRLQLATTEQEFPTFTRLAISRHLGPLDGGSPDWRQVFGAYGANSGSALFQDRATIGTAAALRTAVIGNPTPPQTLFNFIAQTYDAASKTMRTYFGKDGKIIAGGVYVDGVGKVGTAVPLMIGGNNTTVGANGRVLQVNTAAQHNVELTPTQLKAIYLYLSNRAVDLYGLPVL